jgi:hypothetical protein
MKLDLNEICGRYSVKFEISGESVHAASELDFRVNLVRIRFALDSMFRPFEHRWESVICQQQFY